MRLKAHIWVNALIRRAQAGGAMAAVIHRGDNDAGSVMLKLNFLTGQATLYAPFTGLEGARVWRVLQDQAAETDIDAAIKREINLDPDLWVVEIEDRHGRHFIDEPMEAI